MLKEKFVESVLKLDDLDKGGEVFFSLGLEIGDIYENYIRRTNRPGYKYIQILVSYLLFIASKMIKENPTKKKPGLFEVCDNSCENFIERDKEMHEYPEGETVSTILKDLCRRYLDQNVWEEFLKLIDKNDENRFAKATLSQLEMFSSGKTRDFSFTPKWISELALRILDVQNGDKVMDLGCGTAGFMTEMFWNNRLARYVEDGYEKDFPGGKYYGYEIATEEREIAVLRANLLGGHYIGRDFVNVDDEYNKGVCDTNKFDKIFADYPKGLKYLPYNLESKGKSSDWAFNDWICKHLSPNGKAIAIMTNGAAWNTVDIKIRKEFVEKGLIEAIIALPAGLFPNVGIAVTMIVFSHNNKTVKLVDATNKSTGNVLTKDDISYILRGLVSDTEYSKTVSVEELQSNDYVLNYNRYATSDVKFDNGKKFGDLIISVRRGRSYNTKDLSYDKTTTTTDMQYLALANIKNGVIDDELPYLKSDAEFSKRSNAFLKENDLIISKSGQPYKIAVANPRPEQHIIPSGNMYVIELDTNKVSPYYIKSFFESQRGKALLNSRSNRASIINISLEELQKIEIPVPPLATQRKVANAYLARADEYKSYQSKLEDAISRLNSVFDDNYKD